MEEEASSWIRRTKFSHTICHRMDAAHVASFPFKYQEELVYGLKQRPTTSSSSKKPNVITSKNQSYPVSSPIVQNPVTNKHRSVSPLPQSVLSDTFKEARSERKRFSTPIPKRAESEKWSKGKRVNKQSRELKTHEKVKSKKESAWIKYFDHGGGRVNALEAVDEHTVDLSKLFLGIRFAYGANSRLYHGKYDGEAVAVKIIRIPEDEESEMLAARLRKQFSREVNLLSRLHHQNVLKFVAACKKPPVHCIITEYLSEGSLRGYLHKLEEKSTPIPLQKLIAISLDIARGLEYIHSQGVIHRDLKPENILIDEEQRMKIADFGIACEEAYCDSLADDPGTYRWMAPEMIKRKSYGRKVDVYSFGLILWEMVAGSIPYENMNPVQAAFAVVNKNLRPVIPENCPLVMRALIEQCWSLNPDKRPEFWQVVKVLEQCESFLLRDGTLKLVPNNLCYHDHKKGVRHWINKLGPVHPQPTTGSVPMPKPKFS